MTDPGNLYTRKMEEEYVSAEIQLPARQLPRRIAWQCRESRGTRLELQVRSAAGREQLAGARWMGPGGESSFYASPGGELRGLDAESRWFQYRALFRSSDGADWPALTSVEIELQPGRREGEE